MTGSDLCRQGEEKTLTMVVLDESGCNTVSSAEQAADAPTPTKRWKNLMNPRSISVRRFGSEEDVAKSGRRRRVRRAHTIDNTLSRIDTDDVPVREADELSASDKRPAGDAVLMSPSKPSSNRGSLLQRFLASTSRRKSQTHLSGEGSTVSRLTDDEPDTAETSSPVPRTRRATMDTGEISSSKSRAPILSPVATPVGGLRGVLRRFSNDGPRSSTPGKSSQDSIRRRSSRDSLDLEFPEDTIMEGEEYKDVQERLQRKADDLHKSGQIEEAISQWVECLAIAEDNHDTLANKTELLCILVDLHLQASQLQHHDIDDEPFNAEDIEKRSHHHLEAAERYIHRIKPAMVKMTWWRCSIPLVEVLVKAEAWELAILVAERLVEQPGCPAPEPEQLATIHFQVASQKLDNNRQGEALQHLQATVKYLQLVEPQKRDMVMYTQVLQLLASEYNSQGQTALALEAYQELLKCAPIAKHASLYCRMAHIHIVSQQLDLALEQLEAAASSLDSAEPTIRLQLLQTKGDVYCRLGRMEESLEVYQSALKEVVDPAEKAKLLYTLGRLCVRLKRVRQAISYFTLELEITEQELGQQHLSVSRVLHELAKLYDEGLGETKLALKKLKKAMQIELAVLQECQYAITKCQRCNQVTHQMCTNHANLQREVSNQIRDTKRAQGRMHFKLGDFEKALKTSFDGTERRASMSSYHRRPSAVGL